MNRIFASVSIAAAAACACAAPLKVLTVTGDWMSQAWYQDKWTARDGQPNLQRGRFIASEVEKAAPGRFEFTDITNYEGQEYLDANWLSQFDVLLLGDITGWSLNPRFQAAVRPFVENGGGLVYCGSWKWHCAMSKGTPFDEVLPGEFPVDNRSEDWRAADFANEKEAFQPVAAAGAEKHPVLAGLDFSTMPRDAATRNFAFAPRADATVLLASPSGSPVLAVRQLGKGRTAMTGCIFARDAPAEKFGEWPDFGRFYANLFAWLGENSAAKRAETRDAPAAISVSVDFAETGRAIPASVFALHGAHDCPGFAPLKGDAQKLFEELNPSGQLARFSAHCAKAKGEYDFARADSQIAEMDRFGLVPLALFDAYGYGRPDWVWADGSSWSDPSPEAIQMIIDEVDALLAHENGRGGEAGYRLRVPYVEIANEPDLNHRTIAGFGRLLKAVAAHVHANFPGVKVGAFGGYEVPFLKLFVKECGGDIDWISRHPYGWTGEMLFAYEDEVQAYADSLGFDKLQFIVTECDFWIQGRAKFDYIVKRDFEALRRERLLGVLHYRFGQYAEPVYLFGAVWGGWGQDRGAGAPNSPMHDAYDSFWIFRDFRGAKAKVAVESDAGPNLLRHVYADAAADGERLDAVVYYDFGYAGAGYADFAAGTRVSAVEAKVRLSFPPSGKARTLSISKADGEGFETLAETREIAAGATEAEVALSIAPATAFSVSVK